MQTDNRVSKKSTTLTNKKEELWIKLADKSRKLAEEAKGKEETRIKLVETARKLAEEAKGKEETRIKLVETARKLAVVNEKIRVKLAETIRKLAEEAKGKEETRIKLVETARKLAVVNEKIRVKLAETIRKLTIVAKEKEVIRIKLVETAKQLTIVAKEKEVIRIELAETARKLAVVALTRNVSIKSLIQAQHMAKIGNWELNLKNNRLDWSDEIYNIFEIDKGEFGATYEAFLDTIHPEDRAIVDTAYSQSIKNHKPFSIGHRLLMKDGRIKFVREECKTYYESNGKALRSVGTVQDITDQINAKEFMRVSEERYRTLFNSGNDAIFVHDIDEKGNPGNVVDVNDVACKIYGYSKSEFLNISPVKFDEPESFVKTAIPGIKLLFREGKSTFETTHFTKQGKKIYVEINASIFELNGKKMIYSIVRNITGRKESEKILLESNNLNEAIIDSIPGTFYMLDETGRYVRWNKYQRDEIVGKGDGIKDTNAIDTIHPDDRELIGAKIGSVLKDGKTEIVEGRVLLRGGPKFKWFVMTGSKIISGNHAFLVGTGIDITEHKETENKLKEIDKLKDDFLSVTTHELKTPLMPIKSQTQLLLSGDYGEISEKQKMAVEMILRNEELLNTLTNELLDITKIKSNKLKLTLENIDINLLLADIVKDQGDLAKKKSITCSILPTNKIGMIMADKFRLTQVITNLLNNAIKFTPEHGSIEIAVKLLNNELVITIKDTGIGISPENLGKLFVPFFQIEGSVERRYRGTGLGLAICKGIVEAHGGMIWVKSDGLGKGSTFGFSLPINNHVKGAN